MYTLRQIKERNNLDISMFALTQETKHLERELPYGTYAKLLFNEDDVLEVLS